MDLDDCAFFSTAILLVTVSLETRWACAEVHSIGVMSAHTINSVTQTARYDSNFCNMPLD